MKPLKAGKTTVEWNSLFKPFNETEEAVQLSSLFRVDEYGLTRFQNAAVIPKCFQNLKIILAEQIVKSYEKIVLSKKILFFLCFIVHNYQNI